ncbi:MAG TPA: multidrug efflux SMR transporter [Candidatus Nitrosotenuis sp.]|nr:multidrug efflux SMR transporter [Candidatus Nitrosotenuis sp.]
MAWIFLLIAGALEIAWAMGLKSTQGFTRLWPSVFVLLTGLASVVVLGQATKTLPIGTAYAAWTGIGAAGTALLGILFFNESRDPLRLGCIALIIAGVVGLKFFSPN